LIDHKKHKKFSVADENVLLDLGTAISSTIKERIEIDKKCSNEAAAVMVDMMHNLRTPLTALNMATLILLDNHEEKELNASNASSASAKGDADNKNLLTSLDNAVGELKVV
jgi:K+-sensing histidine kinase KdpD